MNIPPVLRIVLPVSKSFISTSPLENLLKRIPKGLKDKTVNITMQRVRRVWSVKPPPFIISSSSLTFRKIIFLLSELPYKTKCWIQFSKPYQWKLIVIRWWWCWHFTLWTQRPDIWMWWCYVAVYVAQDHLITGYQ